MAFKSMAADSLFGYSLSQPFKNYQSVGTPRSLTGSVRGVPQLSLTGSTGAGAYSSIGTYGTRAPVTYGSIGAGAYSSVAGALATPRMNSVGLAGTTTYAGAATTAYTGAPLLSARAAPVTYTTSAVPAVTTVAPTVIETIAAQPAVVEEFVRPAVITAAPASVTGRNLLAMGNVISERVITIEELAAMDRYAAMEPVNVGIVPSSFNVVEQAPVVYEQAPVVYETLAAPTVAYETIAAAPIAYETYGAPAVAYETVETVAPAVYM